MKQFGARLKSVQSIVSPELVGCPVCYPTPPTPHSQLRLKRLTLVLKWGLHPGQPELALAIADVYDQLAALERLPQVDVEPDRRPPCNQHATTVWLAARLAENARTRQEPPPLSKWPDDADGWRRLAAQCGQTRPTAAIDPEHAYPCTAEHHRRPDGGFVTETISIDANLDAKNMRPSETEDSSFPPPRTSPKNG